MKCKFCKYPDSIKINSFEGYPLFLCKSCGSQFIFVETNELIRLKQYYENLYERDFIERPFRKSNYWNHIKKALFKYTPNKISSILDIGCRQGNFLLHFNPDVLREGVELSATFSESCRKQGLTIYNDYIENIKFLKKYQVITAFNIFEHLSDLNIVLEKVCSIVEQGGLIFFEIPTFECAKVRILNLLKIKWFMYIPPEHLSFPSRHYLNTLFLEKGFILRKRWYTSGLIINPFRKIPVLNILFKYFMVLIDLSPLNQFPIFEHMYCIYQKTNNEI
jgi:SAM-dependent methyltransferase